MCTIDVGMAMTTVLGDSCALLVAVVDAALERSSGMRNCGVAIVGMCVVAAVGKGEDGGSCEEESVPGDEARAPGLSARRTGCGSCACDGLAGEQRGETDGTATRTATP